MRILLICDVLFPQTTGGAGRVARELAIAFRNLGCQVQFLTRRTPKAPSDDAIKTTYFPAPGKALPRQYRKAFLETVEDFQPDIIHIHQPLAAFLTIPSHFLKPLVYNFYSPWPDEFKIKSSYLPQKAREMLAPLLAKIEKSVVERAAAVVVLSEYSRAQVARLYNKGTILIPGGVNTGQFRPLEEHRRADDALRLITLRNLVPRMGLSQLVRAMKLLPAHFGVQIGGEGSLRDELETLIRSLGLRERIQLIGHVPDEDLPRFYSSANWFVLPTVALEGFGLVILESLSCGTPVLGTRIGAIPELLERFDPHWIIEEPTPEAIAAAILSVSQTPAPSPEELHDRVTAEFDWGKIAERYLELFTALV